MPILNHNNGKISYTVSGEGDPIVLIHGFGLDQRIWEKQVKELSKTNKVVTYDLRGFGESSLPNGTYSHSDDLNALLKELNISNAKIVGHSFGGEVAIEYALKYPNEVTSLILISPALSGVRGDSTEWEALIELGRNGDIEGIRKRMLGNPIFKDLQEGSEELKLVTEMVLGYTGFHFQNRDPREYTNTSEKLRDLVCTVEVVVGENDEQIQREIARKLKEELGIEPRIIPDCGHMAVLENAELINEIIAESGKEELHSETSVVN